MKLTSTAFAEGQWIPKKYTARGEDLSPALYIEGLDPKARSLIITLDDVSHPLFPNYNHWIIWNITPCAHIPEGIARGEVVESLGNAVQGMAYGRHCYRGAKPPLKTIHNYTFTVFALDSELELDASARKADVLKAAEGHILGKAALTGRFQSHRKE